jgi:hypothetical protein
MTDALRQQPLAKSLPGAVEPELALIVPAAETQQQMWHRAQERVCEDLLSDLQHCICELLSKNQQLRWLLESQRTKQPEEFADD